MDRLSRIYALHRQPAGRRYPVSHKELEQELGCSRATVTRIIQNLRNFFAAPIEYDREANGYRHRHGKSFELPGLWFRAEELEAPLAMQQLLGGLRPGLLDSLLAPFPPAGGGGAGLRAVGPGGSPAQPRRGPPA